MKRGEWTGCVLVVVVLVVSVLCGVWIGRRSVPVPAGVVLTDLILSADVQERWSTWMSDDRVPVFWFWRQRDHGRSWVAVCHMVKRVWSPGYKAWHEDAVSLERALTKVLDLMDRDLELRR